MSGLTPTMVLEDELHAHDEAGATTLRTALGTATFHADGGETHRWTDAGRAMDLMADLLRSRARRDPARDRAAHRCHPVAPRRHGRPRGR
jgi:hypothetical protein